MIARSDTRTPYQRRLDEYHSAVRYWRHVWDAVDWRLRWLLDGEHYEAPTNELPEKDRRLLRWVGRQTFNVWEHEVGTVSDSRSTVIPRPVDESGMDDALGEQAVALVEGETENPVKQFEDVMEAFLGCVAAAGYGAVSIDFLRDAGPWGELVYEEVDPRRFMWNPNFTNIHRMGCDWCAQVKTVRKSQLVGRLGWNKRVIEALVPDGPEGAHRGGTVAETEVPTIKRGEGGGPEWAAEDEVTLVFWWYRADGEDKRRIRGSLATLPPERRYMHCEACDWSSPTAADLGLSELPEESACPQCDRVAERADAEEGVASIRGYPNIRLCIFAPDAGVDDFLYEGPAPWPTRSFPFIFATRSTSPLRPYGPSVVDLSAWNQMCLDMVMTTVIERLAASSPVWSVPDDGVFDDQGQRFEFADDQGHVMFRSPEVGANAIQLLEGTGIPAAWSAVYQSAAAELTAHQGTADVTVGPQQTRDIAASSLSQQIEQKEIPVERFRRRYQRARGFGYGLIFDAIRGTYPDDRVLRLRGPDGRDAVAALAASEMPGYDFDLADAPTFSATDEAKARGMQMLLQVARDNPEHLELFAQVYRIPPSLVRRIRAQEEARVQREQQAMTQAAAMPGAGAGGAPAQPPAAEQDPAAMVDALLAEFTGQGQPQQSQQMQWSQ